MEENKSPGLVPLSEQNGTKISQLRKICVKVYLSEMEFIEWIKLAEDADIRPRGLKPFKQKEHGFSWERIANTKGLVKFIKKTVIPNWIEGETERKEKREKILEEAKKLGMNIIKK